MIIAIRIVGVVIILGLICWWLSKLDYR